MTPASCPRPRPSAMLVLGCLAWLLVSPAAGQQLEIRRPGIAMSLDAPPVVRDWKPRGRAHPGQRLLLKGGPFRVSDLEAELVTPHGRIRVPGGAANDSTALFRITDEMYTGREGAALVIRHRASPRGRASEDRVLVSDFMVLNREAVFRGPSLWREGRSLSSSVLAEGTVTLRVRDLEFADAGTFTYREVVPLLTIVETLDEECAEGRATVPARRLDIRDRTFARSGSWKRLPDGRLQLSGAGVDLRYRDSGTVVLANLSNDIGRVTYETYAPISGDQRPRTEPPHCHRCYSRLVGVGLLVGLELVCNDRPPPAFPLRSIEWSLRRLDGT